MKIAILGWGSLIWNPRELKIDGLWKKDGPLLPIEFARVSNDLRLTLVIKPEFRKVKTLYALSTLNDLKDAITDLQAREQTPNIDSIGFINFSNNTHSIKRIPNEITEELSKWNVEKGFDAIIWTDLGQNFKTKTGLLFNVHNAKRHLASLNQAQYELAKTYISKAPDQIKTQFRKELSEYMKIRSELFTTFNPSSTFFNVKRELLLHYYPEIATNSTAQFKSADSLASIGSYGMGMSHLLISTEEMIKALVVVLDAKGFDLRKIKGMDIFFRNHEIRFFIGFITFVVTLFGEDLIKFLEEMKNTPSRTNELSSLLKDKPKMMGKLKWYFLRKIIIIRNELEWFSKAEAFRQNGFYVDSKGSLISPLLYTEEDYNETKNRISKVNKTIQYIIDAFLTDDKELIEHLEKTKERFHNEKYYTLIENELENRRNGKESFFDKFNTFLVDLIDSIKDPPPGYDKFIAEQK